MDGRKWEEGTLPFTTYDSNPVLSIIPYRRRLETQLGTTHSFFLVGSTMVKYTWK
jgi:hypothetical protein